MRTAIPEAQIAELRAFNRFYTRRLGLLNAHLDRSPFTLAEARILYELAHRVDPTSAQIMRALDLDRAQLSRTLRRFADRGLVEMRDSAAHGRHRLLSLTEAGRQAYAALDRSAIDGIAGLLGELTRQARETLMSATADMRRVLGDLPGGPLTLREPRPGDLGWIIHRQAVLYAEEYGWTAEYEALVVKILGDFAGNFDPDREAAWIAVLGERLVGSVFLVRGDKEGVGKLRLLYVEPDARGQGVGKALVEACIERAREAGYETLVLWTNSVLVAARAIYERAGFVLVEEAAHHSFGHDLVGQTWSLRLRP